MALLLTHSHIYTPESIGAGSVLVDGGRIEAIYRLGEALLEVETPRSWRRKPRSWVH